MADNYHQPRRPRRRLAEAVPRDPAVISALCLSAGALLTAFLFWVLQ
ncbi:MAG TPA: hypothetical protein VK817_10935 [Trebonia sp.]|nr:hypothetical protein [Trebonia sp.]